ncbi:MAG: hypothetical protein Q7V57_17060 [Actinomycetota bacterium]|nr:hypothetical protein [Actinomycetota bacterium]
MRVELFPGEASFAPRPAWQVIEAARQRHLTGELTLATAPTTTVYLRDGEVYFAERSTDSGLGVRLLVSGVINRQQLGKGALLINGIEHLGRMFDRDPSIERQAVELCVETMTDDTLVGAANEIVADYRLTLYRRHSAGIDRWMPARVEVITHVVESSRLGDHDTVPATVPLPQPNVIERLADHLRVVDTDATPVMGVFQRLLPATPAVAPVVAAVPPAVPAVFVPPVIGPAQSAIDAIVTSGLADEVAEAVRRALSAIDAAAQPDMPLSPSDFDLATNPLLERVPALRSF